MKFYKKFLTLHNIFHNLPKNFYGIESDIDELIKKKNQKNNKDD